MPTDPVPNILDQLEYIDQHLLILKNLIAAMKQRRDTVNAQIPNLLGIDDQAQINAKIQQINGRIELLPLAARF